MGALVRRPPHKTDEGRKTLSWPGATAARMFQERNVEAMPQFSVPLGKLAKQLNLESLYAPKDLWQIPITTADINRPGIMLAGFYQYFDATRIQIIGMVEMAYLKDLPDDERRNHLEKLFSMKPPTVIISRGMDPLDEMLDFARWYDVPLMRSAETSSTLMSNLISYLNVELAPRVTRHGVCVEVYGEGILILGDSGVGKSETAVELVTWDKSKTYDRTGLTGENYEILGVQIPSTVIPVMPGRNLAVILETAAITNRQKKMGYSAAQELLTRLGLEDDLSNKT